MSKTAQVATTISASGDGLTLSFTSPVQTNASSPAEHQPVTLSTGDNTITVPTGALGVLIVPVATSTVAKKIKTVGGDSGSPINAAYATFWALVASTATITINAAAPGETISLYWI